MKINGFQGKYRFLSNFWPCSLRVSGIVFPTLEHAYQACQTEHRALIAGCPTPGEAKRAGKRVPLRPGWEGMKEEVMLGLLRAKFSRPGLWEKLLVTGDAELAETNVWGDRLWGSAAGSGKTASASPDAGEAETEGGGEAKSHPLFHR